MVIFNQNELSKNGEKNGHSSTNGDNKLLVSLSSLCPSLTGLPTQTTRKKRRNQSILFLSFLGPPYSRRQDQWRWKFITTAIHIGNTHTHVQCGLTCLSAVIHRRKHRKKRNNEMNRMEKENEIRNVDSDQSRVVIGETLLQFKERVMLTQKNTRQT